MLETSRYIYWTAQLQTCCVQKNGQNGKYFICIGTAKKFGGYFFYDTAEDAQSALDIMASRLGWKH